MFKLGLIINPFAGVGGPLALKGSDDVVARGIVNQQDILLQRASGRAITTLKQLKLPQQCTVYCFGGSMGAEAAGLADLTVNVIGHAKSEVTTAEDTCLAAECLLKQEVDLIVFVGGDGTARDVYSAVGTRIPVLGVPAGVKMHSGVFAVSPEAAAVIINQLMSAGLVDIGLSEVRDIDEQAFREGVVKSRYYGELLVPRQGAFLQQTKSSGVEVEELVIADIAADIIESMEPDCLYIIGPGTTPRGVMDALQLDNTLLGVDAVLNQQLLALDLDEQRLLALIRRHKGPVKIIITAIGGQGHILGRGNQQLSPAVIRLVGHDNLIIVATKTKITALQGRPLLVDSNDPELDQALAGYRQVITGYHDAIIYPVGLTAQQGGAL